MIILSVSELTPEQKNGDFLGVTILPFVAVGLNMTLVSGWRSGKVGLISKFGRCSEIQRDSDPFGYWSVMTFYALVLILTLYAINVSVYRLLAH
jgi:hypothetical protein